jgi:pimeloyl-ACP methyl ester carboxylesterase
MAIGLMRDLSRADTKSLLQGAGVPVRCINAAPETKFAIATAIESNKKYADFNALIMTGVGHFPMLEKPDEFNQKLRETLRDFTK